MQDGWSPKPQSAGIREIRDIASASSATRNTNAPPKQIDIDDAGTAQDYDHKIDFGGWRSSKGEGSGSTPKSESSDGNQETGANRLDGGDKFARYRVCMEGGVPILQEADAHEGDGDVCDVGDDGQAAVATRGGPGKNAACNPFDGKNCERVRNNSGISGACTSGMEREANVGKVGGAMTDGEMAGGMVFGFGNDMRVSI